MVLLQLSQMAHIYFTTEFRDPSSFDDPYSKCLLEQITSSCTPNVTLCLPLTTESPSPHFLINIITASLIILSALNGGKEELQLQAENKTPVILAVNTVAVYR